MPPDADRLIFERPPGSAGWLPARARGLGNTPPGACWSRDPKEQSERPLDNTGAPPASGLRPIDPPPDQPRSSCSSSRLGRASRDRGWSSNIQLREKIESPAPPERRPPALSAKLG